MRIADTTSNIAYHDVKVDADWGTRAFYEELKKQGYNYRYAWQNSDDNWTWFATNEARANEGAAEIVAKKKNWDIKKAREYSYEYMIILDIDHILDEWNLD